MLEEIAKAAGAGLILIERGRSQSLVVVAKAESRDVT
jgi:hypothetical protein